MFSTTFLAHQSWLVGAGDDHVLVDPLLCDRVSEIPPHTGFPVHPPRDIHPSACPPLRAVILTHEHEDHFHLPSLARIDRRVPVHLSALSSVAAEGALRSLGFTVMRAVPGVPVQFGRLECTPFAQDVGIDHPGEWDSLALFARDRDGDGSFFTTVDVRPTHAAFARLPSRPTLATYPDNDWDPQFMMPWIAVAPGDAAHGLAAEITRFDRELPAGNRPDRFVLCANGYGFDGDVAWLDRAVWFRDGASVAALVTDARAIAPVPGDTVQCERGAVVSAGASVPWIRARPRASWPVRGSGTIAAGGVEASPPVTGQLALGASEQVRLARALDAFAQSLYGSALFRALLAMEGRLPGGRAATIAFEVRERDVRGSISTVFAYDPCACSFRRVPCADASQAFVAGARLWASDLLALLEARVYAGHVTLGRIAFWNALPATFRADRLLLALHQFAHPLRQPAAFARLYERILAGIPSEPPVFRAR